MEFVHTLLCFVFCQGDIFPLPRVLYDGHMGAQFCISSQRSLFKTLKPNTPRLRTCLEEGKIRGGEGRAGLQVKTKQLGVTLCCCGCIASHFLRLGVVVSGGGVEIKMTEEKSRSPTFSEFVAVGFFEKMGID